MKLTPEQRQNKKDQYASLSKRKKLEHIWTYYKWYILLVLIAVSVLFSAIHRSLTEKDPVLYMAYLNVSVGEEIETSLTEDYLLFRDYDLQKKHLLLYRDLYLANEPSPENHEYAYTSSLKVMATIQAKELDLVLMNREAYDLCSGNGYLLDLTQLVSPENPFLTENLVILDDNAIEVNLGQASEYRAVSESVPNALVLSNLPTFSDAGISGAIYLGIIANTPRLSECAEYLAFLTK